MHKLHQLFLKPRLYYGHLNYGTLLANESRKYCSVLYCPVHLPNRLKFINYVHPQELI
jgi:hypothetical protein